ncbi:MAG: STAS-like domain-containing protein [Pirellulales bacterium]|nr:STAS-like domain-containing protein [Pirellulales bacterium]
MTTTHDESTWQTVKLVDHGTILATRDQGEPVRKQLLETLDQRAGIEIDLNGVEVFTPSFIDEVIGKMFAILGRERFRSQVRLHANAEDVRRLVNLVIANRANGHESN